MSIQSKEWFMKRIKQKILHIQSVKGWRLYCAISHGLQLVFRTILSTFGLHQDQSIFTASNFLYVTGYVSKIQAFFPSCNCNPFFTRYPAHILFLPLFWSIKSRKLLVSLSLRSVSWTRPRILGWSKCDLVIFFYLDFGWYHVSMICKIFILLVCLLFFISYELSM